jgi:hypothetical protein
LSLSQSGSSRKAARRWIQRPWVGRVDCDSEFSIPPVARTSHCPSVALPMQRLQLEVGACAVPETRLCRPRRLCTGATAGSGGSNQSCVSGLTVGTRGRRAPAHLRQPLACPSPRARGPGDLRCQCRHMQVPRRAKGPLGNRPSAAAPARRAGPLAGPLRSGQVRVRFV